MHDNFVLGCVVWKEYSRARQPTAIGVSLLHKIAKRSNIGKAPIEQNPYFRFGFVLADQTGKLMFLSPGLPEEHVIELWIDRTLRQAQVP
jgi:hypothetical protein